MDYMDAHVPPKPDPMAAKEEMLREFDSSWEFAVTGQGQPCILKPGFQITRWWSSHYQCVIISTKYRFVGQGESPRYALEDAVRQMREFREELDKHLEAI